MEKLRGASPFEKKSPGNVFPLLLVFPCVIFVQLVYSLLEYNGYSLADNYVHLKRRSFLVDEGVCYVIAVLRSNMYYCTV